LKTIQVAQNNNTKIFWYEAKDFPNLSSVNPEIEDIDKDIEDVLAHSHKWKDQKDVKCTMDEIDLKDNVARVNRKYTQNLCLRLGKTRDPLLEVAKSRAGSMKEAALTWQEKAIKSINDTAAALQKDNKRVIRKSEVSHETKELKKQLEALNKKHTELQTEFNFTSASLALKTKMEASKDSNSDTLKITELTRELGEQRKHNEELEEQLRALLESFSN
jgi:hypothetical protein